MNKKGITLIELLIALVISSILVGGIYRTFIRQQHTYTVQEQVVDMQQNMRVAINQMVREIRMGGFGRQDVGASNNGVLGGGGMHGLYKNVINPADDGNGITVVAAQQQLGTVKEHAGSGSNFIKVTNPSAFNTALKGYISINGTESHRIHSIAGDQVNFFPGVGLKENHAVGEPVFLVVAVTYMLGLSDGKMCLLRNENLGEGPQVVADNVEFMQFTYTLADGITVFQGIVPGNRRDEIRLVQVQIRARTDRNDPELAGGDGFRRRTLTSNIQLRNLTSL